MRGHILTIVSWVAILTMFAYIGYGLAKQFDYLNPPNLHLHLSSPTYTNQAFESLVYEHYMNANRLGECEEVIDDILKVSK